MKRIRLVLALGLLSAPAWAQDAGMTKAPSASDVGKGPSFPENRSGRNFGVGGRAGTIVSYNIGVGIDAYWVQSSALQIGLFVGGGGFDFTEMIEDKIDNGSVNVRKVDMSAGLALVQARYFVGDSLHLTAGIGQRQTHMEYDVEDSGGTNRIKATVKTDVPVIHFALGNTWTWPSGFYLGADWFALTLPLGQHKADVKMEAQGTLSADAADAAHEASNYGSMFAKVGSVQVGLFHIGRVF